VIATIDDCRTYTPYGGARELWQAREEAVLFEGPAGTGKTRGLLEKGNLILMKYPGARGLIVRKTRASMTESVLVTFEEKVLPAGSPVKGNVRREHRSAYHYPNGSELVVGGLDNPDRMMSTEYDFIYIFEATEVTADDAEKLDTRLRNGVVPYQQLVFDCNPGPSLHWLNTRAHGGDVRRVLSRHTDNPMLFDQVTHEATREGERYLVRLDRLTGHRKLRLRDGIWAAAEGVIYERFDPAIHVVKRSGPWARFVAGVDYGHSHPFSCTLYGVDSDGRTHAIKNIYRTGLVEDGMVRAVRMVCSGLDIEAVVVDEAQPAFIAALRNAGFPAVGCDKTVPVLDGIVKVQTRLRVQADGRPRHTIDPSCVAHRQEYESYSWAKTREGQSKDTPEKAHDHAMDETRYVVVYLDAGVELRVTSISGGDEVEVEDEGAWEEAGVWV